MAIIRIEITSCGVLARLDVKIFTEDNVVIVYSPALDLCGYGYTYTEAIDSFRIAVAEFFEYGLSNKTLDADLRLHGWNVA